MTATERALALLAEVNPPVAAALGRAGANRAGDPLVGLLGWMPAPDRLDLARAAFLARDPEDARRRGVHYEGSPFALARAIVEGAWLRPRWAVDEPRLHEAVLAYARARGEEPLGWHLMVKQRQEGAA